MFCVPPLTPHNFPVIPQILPFSFGEEAMNTGDSTSLTCTITKGDLPVEITWSHNNTNLTNDGNIVILKMSRKISTLSFDSVQAEHLGGYTCTARNSAGSSTHTAFLNVNGTHILSLLFLVPRPVLTLTFYSCPTNPAFRFR